MYRISKQFEFSASHVLADLPPEHPCGRMHGHNYVIELVLEAPDLDRIGFVTDYRALDPVKQWINATLDHYHLNAVLDGNPTAERLARFVFDKWRGDYLTLAAVRVSETPKTWAEYRPSIGDAVAQGGGKASRWLPGNDPRPPYRPLPDVQLRGGGEEARR